MKIIQNILIGIIIMSLDFAIAQHPRAQQKIAQVRASAPIIQQRAQAQIKPQAKKAATKKTSAATKPTTKTPQQQKHDDGNIPQLITDLIKAVDQITCSCGTNNANKKSSSDTSKKPVPSRKSEKQCEDKDHKNKVEKAYQAYEKLYKASKNRFIEKSESDKVKPAIHKLFMCRNIKNMPWQVSSKSKQPAQKK